MARSSTLRLCQCVAALPVRANAISTLDDRQVELVFNKKLTGFNVSANKLLPSDPLLELFEVSRFFFGIKSGFPWIFRPSILG